jgi:phosphatidylglycerol:prolipoprotein diacylglycerol transferase
LLFNQRPVYPRLFQLGSIAIPTAGVLTAIAILVALFTARITARRLDLNSEKIWDLGIVAVLTSLFAPRLILIFTNWKDFLAHPLWLIGVLRVRSEGALLGGMAVAIAVTGTFIFLTRMPFRRTLDALAPSLALGFAIASVGAFAGGSNFGTPTNLPWAVTYTSRLASLWNGVPLGSPLHPVQLYAALAALCVCALLLKLIANHDKWNIRNGEIMGTWLFLHGAISFLLNLLRGDLIATNFLLPQSLAAVMVLAGGLLWLL